MSVYSNVGHSTEIVRNVDQYRVEGEVSIHQHVTIAKKRTQWKRHRQKVLAQFQANGEVRSLFLMKKQQTEVNSV
jgi:hypothetical protein